MATPEEVQKLATLARIDVDATEVAAFAKEFDGILAYVGKIEALSVTVEPDTRPSVRNALRSDGEPHESGEYTERLTAQFPERQGDLLKVKQIIQHD